ncbi:hypothetical protein FIA58_016285 [Flavobacterium jejuense]|uniref:Lipoprotein n=1 Tax=Flavobacterium jejuense TaxID=1544455 RepID=A0ABX0ITX4_9FLAO|nr:hypothetical protein [Flavobacterium jejuense]NHN27242.1 hypothetical protein [Flavobacterium jejuense]
MKKIFLILVVFFTISCETSEELQTINVSNYSIQLPSYLSESKELNDEASLQYQNIFKELYIIVIHENKGELENALTENGIDEIYSNDFDGYVDLLSTGLASNIEMKNKIEKDTVINSLETRVMKFEGKVEDFNVFYEVAYVNGIDNYYQIMTWTLLKKKSDYEDIMDKMIHSFKVKKNSKKGFKGAKK